MKKQNSTQYIIGIDIGGTNMKAVLWDEKNEKIIADYMLATPKDTLDHFLIMVNALIEPLIKKAQKDKIKIKGIGMGIPGLLDQEKEEVVKTPNISILNSVELIKKLKEKIDLPVKMDNDVNCFLRAEMKKGAGKKYQNVYSVTIGTGIGGAWWIKDEIYEGFHGGGGEPGRILVDFDQSLDLEEAYHKLTQNNPVKLAEEAYRGDNLAQKSFQEIGEYLGITFANIVNLIDPEVIIIGGGVVNSSDLFLASLKKKIKKYIMGSKIQKIKILKSKLGERAGAIGAALLWE